MASVGADEEESVWAKEKREMEERRKKKSQATDNAGGDEVKTNSSTSAAPSTADVEADEQQVRDSIMNLQLDHLNISHEEIDFSEVDDDLLKFQKDAIVKEALSQGVDLRLYARQIDQELREAENACVQDYVQDADELASLHRQIHQCDGILERMQDMLSKFQGDLGTISSEIKHLQDRSMAMNIQVANRKVAEQRLSTFINSIMVPPDLVTQICEAEVRESYVECLMVLNNKIQVLELPDIKNARAAVDIRPTINTLRQKAMARVRHYLIQQIHGLRKQKTNIQVKQDILLKMKYFYEFLLDQSTPDKDVANEIRETYVETVSKRYHSHFKTYLADMRKVQSSTSVAKDDLLGTDESKTGGLFSARKTTHHLNQVFSLGQRDDILRNMDEPPILVHVAEKTKTKYPYEHAFRSAQRLLMDTATSEYAFLVEFFGHPQEMLSNGSGSQKNTHANAMFTHIFARTLSMFLENLEDFLFASYDCVGLLIMIRVVWQHNKIMQQRRVSCLDAFFDRINMLLWPRFKHVWDLNLASVTHFPIDTVSKTAVQPHFITMRYAQLCASILTLNVEYKDDILISNLARLRTEMEHLLKRMAQIITVPKSRVIFLINNYDVILQVLQIKNLTSEETVKFQEYRSSQIGKFVEEELAEKFGRLISFVKETENKLSNKARANEDADQKDAPNTVELDKGQVESIVKHFAKFWRDGIERINSSVSRSFSVRIGQGATGAGTEILKQVLVQLVLYYQRFQDILKKCFTVLPAFTKELVPIPTIMYEIKKYGQTQGSR